MIKNASNINSGSLGGVFIKRGVEELFRDCSDDVRLMIRSQNFANSKSASQFAIFYHSWVEKWFWEVFITSNPSISPDKSNGFNSHNAIQMFIPVFIHGLGEHSADFQGWLMNVDNSYIQSICSWWFPMFFSMVFPHDAGSFCPGQAFDDDPETYFWAVSPQVQLVRGPR